MVLFSSLVYGAVIPAEAKSSRSATVMVSCTILPSLELSSKTPAKDHPSLYSVPAQSLRNELGIVSQNNQIHVNTNLGNQYRIIETVLKNNGQNVKLYSVTAL